MEYKSLIFEPMTEEDIGILTPIMEGAFNEDAKIHLNEEKGGPEGYDNGDFLRKYGLDPGSDAYKVELNHKVIGALILWINKTTKINFLGNIFVDHQLQNKGIGKLIWEFAEQEYPDTIMWRTETPAYSRRNHNFYINKCGFHVVRIDHPEDIREGSFIFEKMMK